MHTCTCTLTNTHMRQVNIYTPDLVWAMCSRSVLKHSNRITWPPLALPIERACVTWSECAFGASDDAETRTMTTIIDNSTINCWHAQPRTQLCRPASMGSLFLARQDFRQDVFVFPTSYNNAAGTLPYNWSIGLCASDAAPLHPPCSCYAVECGAEAMLLTLAQPHRSSRRYSAYCPWQYKQAGSVGLNTKLIV